MPQRLFFGRTDELRRFDEVLASPTGQAVLVVGSPGMGKTVLLDRVRDMALGHPNLKCGVVRYEVTESDTPASTISASSQFSQLTPSSCAMVNWIASTRAK